MATIEFNNVADINCIYDKKSWVFVPYVLGELIDIDRSVVIVPKDQLNIPFKNKSGYNIIYVTPESEVNIGVTYIRWVILTESILTQKYKYVWSQIRGNMSCSRIYLYPDEIPYSLMKQRTSISILISDTTPVEQIGVVHYSTFIQRLAEFRRHPGSVYFYDNRAYKNSALTKKLPKFKRIRMYQPLCLQKYVMYQLAIDEFAKNAKTMIGGDIIRIIIGMLDFMDWPPFVNEKSKFKIK